MLKRSIGIVSIGLVALSMAATTQDAVTLRRALSEGTTDVYRIQSVSDFSLELPGQEPMGMKSDMSATYTMKIGKVDAEKGVADLEAVTSDIELKIESPMGGGDGAEPPKEIRTTGKIDSLGRQTEMKIQGVTGEMLMVMGASSMTGESFFTFPEKAVKAGDTWEVLTPKVPMLGNKEHKLTAKFVGEEAYESVKAMKVTVTGTIPMDVNIAEMIKQMGAEDPTGGMMDSLQPMLRGNIAVVSTALLDKATGRALSIETTMDLKTRMEVGGGSMTANAPGKAKTTMKLKK